MSTERVCRLRADLFEMDDRVLFMERLTILSDCEQRYANLDAGERFGRALADLLAGISVVIAGDDLIVGRVNETVPTLEEERWFEEHRADHMRRSWFWSSGHLILSWERLLAEGLDGIRQRARRTMDRLVGQDGGVSRSQRDFLRGTFLCCDAIELYAHRYADAAETQAGHASSAERRDELLHISHILRHVPARPARTFQEALQSIWLVDLVLHTVVGSRDFTPGRMDQYLYPYYSRDLENGTLTSDAALELIECFFIKCSEIIGLGDQANASKRSPCQDSVQYVVLGGQTESAQDATNDLSALILQAGYLKLKQPTIIVRHHSGIDGAFWRQVCELVRAGGSVGVYNDATVIPAMLRLGVEPEHALGYGFYGCCNANLPGREGSLREKWYALPKLLELALNDGLDPLTGEQAGPRTGCAESMVALDDLVDAVRLQMRHVLQAERAQYPPLGDQDRAQCSFTLESIFLEDCVENGREWRLGGTQYSHKNQHAVGIGTAADSMAAIAQIVFNGGELALAELRDTLNADFDEHESLRLRLHNRMPKYGNDDDRADHWAAQLAEMWCDEVERCNLAPHHEVFWPEIYSYHNNRHLGRATGATADGRRRGQHLRENQSPSPGMDRVGVTACLNSMAKLPLDRTPGGGTNLRLHPTAVAGEDGLDALSQLFVTYFGQGGQFLQINIVDSETLRQAQRDPVAHRSLSVRVTGYSAYFVTLAQEVQEALIARSEHGA